MSLSNQLSRLPGNETVQSQEKKSRELVRIHSEETRRQWKWNKILELMETTFGTERKEINKMSKVIEELQKAVRLGREPWIPPGVNVEDCHVANITERWPFLLQFKTAALHFKLLTDYVIIDNITNFVHNYSADIITFFLGYQKKSKKCAGSINI